jgi:hypothetical protein
MIDTGVGERPCRVGNEARPVFDVLLGKLRIPSTRPESVRRTSLIDRLVRDVTRPIVSVVAPAGCGKTTLLVTRSMTRTPLVLPTGAPAVVW